MITTIEKMATSVDEFHPYILVPFDKTSMTIPAILFYAIATKYESPREFFKLTATHVKSEILASGQVSEKELQGKLSRKVQEVSWCEIIKGHESSDIDLVLFRKAKLIPYGNTSMTVPMFLYNVVLDKFKGDKKCARQYISKKAEDIKSDILSNTVLSSKDLRGKISHKIQENIWLDFIPERIRNFPIQSLA